MDPSALARHDLNLLVSLHALLSERHVSRAAARLGMSQPTMSRALARLRAMFDDPLFIRVKSGVHPTARALELYPQVEALLAGVHALMRPPQFDPRAASGVIRVAAPDIAVYMLVPPLLRALAEEAPGLDLEILKWSPDWRQRLEDGSVDLTVGTPTGEEPNLYSRALIKADWMCVLRSGHPVLREKWTLARFVALNHMLVSLTGRGGGPVDAALAQRGLSRRVALRVPYPALTPLLIAETELVLTTNRWLARKLAKPAGLVLRRPPLAIPPIRAPMVWHERTHRDPRQRWVRELLGRIAADLKDR